MHQAALEFWRYSAKKEFHLLQFVYTDGDFSIINRPDLEHCFCEWYIERVITIISSLLSTLPLLSVIGELTQPEQTTRISSELMREINVVNYLRTERAVQLNMLHH